MFCTIPRSALPKDVEDSKMECKPSGLPEIISFIEGKNGCEVYHDGKMSIVIRPRPYLGSIQKCAYVLFYEQKFSNFVAADGLKIKIGDQYLNLPCGEALFQMMKAAQSQDWVSFWEIYNAEKPKNCKTLGHKVKNFDVGNWKAVSYDTSSRARTSSKASTISPRLLLQRKSPSSVSRSAARRTTSTASAWESSRL
jgi:predicted NAD-dependent protein-ADP-ribosyltransferase YbiA (DUF1768 family)